MKTVLTIGILTVCGVGAIPVGGYGAEKPVTSDTVAKETREALEATKHYTVQQKEAFQQAAREDLAAIQRQILALRSKVGQVSDSARAELQQSIRDLEVKKDATRKKLDELRLASDSTWDEVKSGIHTAIDEMKQSYRNLLSHLP